MNYCYLVVVRQSNVCLWCVQVRNGLVPLIQEIKAKGTPPDSSILQGSFDTKAQSALCNAIAVDLGFSLEQGRLDVSVHPFTGGETVDHSAAISVRSSIPKNTLLQCTQTQFVLCNVSSAVLVFSLEQGLLDVSTHFSLESTYHFVSMSVFHIIFQHTTTVCKDTVCIF